jgi:hypothetical protein
MDIREYSFSYPECPEDCDLIKECKDCGKMAAFLLEDVVFSCYNPSKAFKVWKVR